VDEVVTLVSIGLGQAAVDRCTAGDTSRDDRITVDEILTSVQHGLRGCQRFISLDIQLARAGATVRVTARLTNNASEDIFYLAGCSAKCLPLIHQAISFEVVGPNGEPVVVKSSANPYQCGGPLLCPEYAVNLGAGESLHDVLEIDGTGWQLTDVYGPCEPCGPVAFAPGRYTVTARVRYSFDAGGVHEPSGHLEKSLEFDWP
jgi:hypothetical protein